MLFQSKPSFYTFSPLSRLTKESHTDDADGDMMSNECNAFGKSAPRQKTKADRAQNNESRKVQKLESQNECV